MVSEEHASLQWALDECGSNAAVLAAHSGNRVLLHWLQQRGVDLYACNAQGETALTVAAGAGHYPLFKELFMAVRAHPVRAARVRH